jgi:hypothetical protein
MQNGPQLGSILSLKFQSFGSTLESCNFQTIESKPCSCKKFGDNHVQTWTVRLVQYEFQVDSDFALSLRANSTEIQCKFVNDFHNKLVAGM